MKTKIKNIFNTNSMKLFILLSSYFLLVLVLYTLFQILNMKNTLGLIQVLSIAIPLIIFLINENQKKERKSNLIIISIYLFLLIIVPFIYSKTYDLTIDGNTYHKTAIAFIKNGWNPLYEDSIDFQNEHADEIIKFDKSSRLDKWIDHYPKATWIVSAVMYEFTGSIESGKSITFIFTIMLLIISYNCLNTILSRNQSLIISAMIALNPITLSQIFTYYVDSLMGIFFAIELFLLFMINPMKKQNNLVWLSLISICTIFVNIKYTGLLVSGVLAAVFYFYWLIKYHKEKDFWINFRNITIRFCIVFITAIFFVGSNSYVKNTIDHKNPLYPIIGKDKIDIITTMQPKSFKNKNMLEKFLISTFYKTENVTYTMTPTPKLPFVITKDEILTLELADVRIGGFGPLFGLMLIISIVVLSYNTYLIVKHEKNNLSYILLPIIAIVISSIMVGENWWARYVPHLYLVIVGALLFTFYNSKYFKNKNYYKTLVCIILVPVIINTSCFLYNNLRSLNNFRKINNDIVEMKNTKDLNLKLGLDGLYGYLYTLNDEGVKYTLVDKIDDKHGRYVYCWRVMVEDK